MSSPLESQRRYLDSKLSKIKSGYSLTVKSTDRGLRVDAAIAAEDLDKDAWLVDDACARQAWAAVHELIFSAKPQQFLRLQDTRLSLFCKGGGDVLAALAEIVFCDETQCFIRVKLHQIYSGQDLNPANCIGEYNVQGQWQQLDEVVASTEAMLAARDEAKAEAKADTTDAKPSALSAKEQAMEDKRRRIFEGACEVIGREGYAATTIRKVAKAAGLPISTMYQYIETKEDLLFMITSGCMAEIFEYMTGEMRSDNPPEQKLADAVSAYMQYISKNRRYINLVYRETRALSRPNREKVFDIERKFTQLWEEIIIEGNKHHVFDAQKSRLAANMVYFFCNVWSLRYWSVQDYTEDEVKEYLMRFISAGLKS